MPFKTGGGINLSRLSPLMSMQSGFLLFYSFSNCFPFFFLFSKHSFIVILLLDIVGGFYFLFLFFIDYLYTNFDSVYLCAPETARKQTYDT